MDGNRPLARINSNVLLLYAARGIRGFGDGFAIIILPAYLSAIGMNPVQIGVVATAALLGTSLMTLAIGFVAPRHDMRNLLLARRGADGRHRPRLPAGRAHRVHPAGRRSSAPSIHRPGIPACWCPWNTPCWRKTSPDDERTRTFARYSLIGALSAAAGSLAAAVPDLLAPLGIERIGAFRLMFYAYAALGLVGAALYARLPHMKPEQAAARRAARTVTRHGLQACRAVQPQFLRRRLRRAIAAGALAVRAVRFVAVRGQPVLLLDRRLQRILLSGRGPARQTHRPDQHDGLHAHSVQRVSDHRGVLDQPLSDARACCCCAPRCRRWTCRPGPPT